MSEYTTPTTEQLLNATNICDLLDPKQVQEIGAECALGLQTDVGSRAEWDERNAKANKLALQVSEKKTWPWPNASNVKFPLITVAALQFQAKAYPALVPGSDLVKTKIYGADPDGKKRASGDRVAAHMTWQNLEQDAGFEEEMDKLLLVEAIAGCVFKKRIFDPTRGRQCSRMVLPVNFVINYWCRDLDNAPRYTETFHFSENDIRTRVVDGRFRNLLETDYSEQRKVTSALSQQVQPDQTAQQQSPTVVATNQRQGIQPYGEDRATPYFTAEQYCWWDLDGDDYAEPYIVTFDVDSGAVYRICARYLPSGIKKNAKGEIVEITPVKVYTKYSFIPSPDGGFYDLGLGALEGPLNESVNSALNQMFDAGTMAMLGGGFLGRGFKSKAGAFTFAPNEWKPVDGVGDDLRKNIFPLPVRDPPVIMFQLLQFLVNYGERIVSATDLQMGENIGQNTPAETARTMDQNGARIYNSIFKRNWRALRNEFRQQAQLNLLYLRFDVDYDQLVRDGMITQDDYAMMGISIRPAADPHVVSDGERQKQAAVVLQNAMTLPGHNRYQAILNWYKVNQVPDYERFYPPLADGQTDFPPPPPDPKMIQAQVAAAGQKLDEAEFAAAQQERQFTLPKELQEGDARIAKLFSDAQLAIAKSGNEELEPLIQQMWAAVESQGRKRDHLIKLIELATPKKEGENGSGGAPSVSMSKVDEMAAKTGLAVPKAIQ